MTTLRLSGGRELKRNRQRSVYFSRLRPFTGRRSQDESLRVKEPPPVLRMTLTMEKLLHARRRQNSLHPQLAPTDRMLLRWGESGGNGLPNPEADIRETHYDPLPPDLQQRVDDIVAHSPWEALTRRWYRTNLPVKDLAEQLCIPRRQIYYDWNSALWYYRGRFESERVYE
jgi:hypothetical protein